MRALPACERGHGHDDGVERIRLAGDDLLQVRDHLGRHCDRVDGLVRVRAVSSRPDDLEREQVGGRHDRARPGRHLPCLEPREQVHARHERRTLDDTCRDHIPRPAGRKLLGVLEDEPHLALELVTPVDEDLGRCQQHRGVAVVAAGVHHARPRRCVRQVVFLQDRQRVHVSAENDELPRPGTLERRHDGRARRPLDLEVAERGERFLDVRGCLVLLEGELGMGV